MAVGSLIVEPPKQQGRKSSSADQEILTAMAKQVQQGVFVGDGKVFKTAKDAGNEANVYRRGLARALNVEDYKIVSRVWGYDKNGNVLADREKNGEWQFGLTVNHDRVKRQRNRTTA